MLTDFVHATEWSDTSISFLTVISYEFSAKSINIITIEYAHDWRQGDKSFIESSIWH